MLALAITRLDVANYVLALFIVYIALNLVYAVANMIFMFARPAYSRNVDIVMRFLRDVCEPYLRLFRRILPNFPVIDLSFTVGVFVLFALAATVPHLISGG